MNTTEKKVISCLLSEMFSQCACNNNNQEFSRFLSTSDGHKKFFLSLSKVIACRIKLFRASLTRRAGKRRREHFYGQKVSSSRLNWIKVPTIHCEMQQRVSANLALFSFFIFRSKTKNLKCTTNAKCINSSQECCTLQSQTALLPRFGNLIKLKNSNERPRTALPQKHSQFPEKRGQGHLWWSLQACLLSVTNVVP